MLRNLWYKSAIIYQLDVRTFFDSDGNGWGDFQGLIEKLDYISGLGATCIWLKPFNPSPHRDDGYDISDYYAVDPHVGTLGDLADFLEEAASRGLAVITELVVNHTSTEHPWFVEAARSRDSELRDLYIWRDEPPPDGESPERIVFDGDDRSVWTKDDRTGQYYLHRFYPFEPDLDSAHPFLRSEIEKMILYYLKLGSAGFRIDAAPYLAEKASAAPEYDDAHDYLRDLRSFLTERRPDAAFMAEADVEPEKLDDFFGEGDEMNLMLNFLASEYIWLGLAQGSAVPLRELCDVLPRPPHSGQYANFLRNHDELDLEMLDEQDRRLVFETFAPHDDMRIFGRGIRRRAAPMLNGDPRRIRLAHSLLFSMPGTPIIYYGDEIGMGEDLSLWERRPVRLPMQWGPETNGGFSTATGDALYHPPLADGEFGYAEVNVADQRGDPDSLLNWMRHLVTTRKEAHAVGHGEWHVIDTGSDAVLGLHYDNNQEVVIVFHNLSDEASSVTFTPETELAYLYEMFADDQYGHPETEEHQFKINRLGYRWLRGRTA
ncbi:MAG TPA: alpha-amylase family protein [Acidimicrobiia bacterium]|nr:alpha-amylase family protein [Acidimicrobiia bacterium]